MDYDICIKIFKNSCKAAIKHLFLILINYNSSLIACTDSESNLYILMKIKKAKKKCKYKRNYEGF